MSISVLRTADAWYVQTPTGAARIDTGATTTAGAAGRPGRDRRGRGGHRHACPVEQPGAGLAGHRAVPGRGADDQLRLPRHRLRHGPGHDPADLLPQGVGIDQRPDRRRHAARPRAAAGLRGRDRPGHRPRAAGRHRDHRGQPRRVRRGPGGHQRRVRPRRAAAPDPVLRGQVLPHLHARRARPGAAGRPTSSSGSATCGCGCRSTDRCARTPASAAT